MIDEVLDDPRRIRLVLCGRGTPKDELCAAAALRAVDNGQLVLYFNPTSLGSQYVREQVFPKPLPPGITFLTLAWFDQHKFVIEAAEVLTYRPPGLIIIHDWYLHKRWSQVHICGTLEKVLQATDARLLIATPPTSSSRLAKSRLYRLWRQGERLPDSIGTWRWPSPPDYLAGTAAWHYTPAMYKRELLAEWGDEDGQS